jgi:hypothetical protein
MRFRQFTATVMLLAGLTCISVLSNTARALPLADSEQMEAHSAADQTAPLPPCVDGQYALGAAGTGCAVHADTTPTARCRDGSFDYSRSFDACAGAGGVLMWLGSSTSPTTTTPAGGVSPAATTTPGNGSSVSFTQVTGGSPGGAASATIQAPANAQCSLTFFTPNGDVSNATGLQGMQTADPSGHFTWIWKVDSSSKVGPGQLIAACSPGGSASTAISIG